MGVPESGWDGRSDGVGTAGLKGKGTSRGAGTADLAGEVPDRGRDNGGPARGASDRARPCVREEREPGSRSLRGAS